MDNQAEVDSRKSTLAASLRNVLSNPDYKETIGKWLEQSKIDLISELVNAKKAIDVVRLQGRLSTFVDLEDYQRSIEINGRAASERSMKRVLRESK